MSAQELAHKRLCSESGISSKLIRTGRITPDEQADLADASHRVAADNLLLHDWPEIRPADIHRAARRFNAEAIFVDYLQYVTPPDSRKKRYEQVGEISRRLKTIARGMDVPVVACAQIGRQAAQGRETRPKLSHLRESGNIENDCDVALLLWRPDGGIGSPRDSRWDAELEVAKNRKGPTTRLRLDWDGVRTSFFCHRGTI
jgi:replicative DNA helicase